MPETYTVLRVNCISIKLKGKKWAKNLNRCLSKEDMQMANKHVKRCLIVREMQTKTTVNYQLIPSRMAIIKKSDKKRDNNTSVDEDMNKNPHTLAGGNVKWYCHFGKQYSNSSKCSSCHLSQKFYSHIYIQGNWKHVISKGTENMYPHKNLYTNIHSNSIQNSQKIETIQMSISW